MYRIEYNCFVLRKSVSTTLVFLYLFGTVGLLTYVVLFATRKTTSAEMDAMRPWMLGAGAAFFVLAILVQLLSRIKVAVTGADEKLTVTIFDGNNPKVFTATDPDKVEMLWHETHTGRRARMKILQLTMLDNHGTPVVSFTSALGAVYEAPPHFRFIDVMNPEERSRLRLAALVYDTSKTADLALEISVYLNYLRNKAASGKN